jgi:hypothetical protein
MVKQEQTGERCSAYSTFHRELGAECLAVDVDWVEYREGRGIVAFIATTGRCVDSAHILKCKPHIWNRTVVEREILCVLSIHVGAPAFYVIHSDDLSVFHVHNLRESLSVYRQMTREEYSSFIQSL